MEEDGGEITETEKLNGKDQAPKNQDLREKWKLERDVKAARKTRTRTNRESENRNQRERKKSGGKKGC